MLRHPLWIGGWLIVVAGFGLLIFWAPVSVRGYGMESQPVLNLHRLEISRGVMWIGFVLSVSGVIIGGFKSLRGVGIGIAVSPPVASSAASPATGVADEDLGPEIDEDLESAVEVVMIKDRQGRDRALMIGHDGVIRADTLTGPKEFASVEAAREYFR